MRTRVLVHDLVSTIRRAAARRFAAPTTVQADPRSRGGCRLAGPPGNAGSSFAWQSRPWIAVQLLALGGVISMAGCHAEVAGTPAAKEPKVETIEAEVLTLELSTWPTVVRSQGSLLGDEQSMVGAKVAGRVAEVHFDLGDFVKTGEPLVTLDQEEFELAAAQTEAQLQQARSAVGLRSGESVDSLVPENAPPVREQMAVWDEAKGTLKRSEELRRNNAISQGDVEQAIAAERVAEARYASAINSVLEKIALIGVREAELSLARQRLQDATIRSPMDGYVQQRQVAPGTYLAAGQPIAVLVRTDPLRFRGTVPERHAQALAIGQEVRLRIESVEGPRVATITRVSPMLDQQSRALAFEAEIDNSDYELRAGLFAEAEVVVDPDAKALVVPHSAVVEFAGNQKVWMIVDGMASEREVLPGTRREIGREIIEGLAVGDQILSDANQGRFAKVIPKKE
jgi:RND family efflux transporter MFP subunit